MKNHYLTILTGLSIVAAILFIGLIIAPQEVYIRHNIVGYLPEDTKVALAFSHQRVAGDFSLVDANTKEPVFQGKLKKSKTKGNGGGVSFRKRIYFLSSWSKL